MSPLLTVAETAEFLRTSPGAVRVMICRGRLPGVVHIGRRVLVRRADLEEMIGVDAEKGDRSCGSGPKNTRG